MGAKISKQQTKSLKSSFIAGNDTALSTALLCASLIAHTENFTYMICKLMFWDKLKGLCHVTLECCGEIIS